MHTRTLTCVEDSLAVLLQHTHTHTQTEMHTHTHTRTLLCIHAHLHAYARTTHTHTPLEDARSHTHIHTSHHTYTHTLRMALLCFSSTRRSRCSRATSACLHASKADAASACSSQHSGIEAWSAHNICTGLWQNKAWQK